MSFIFLESQTNMECFSHAMHDCKSSRKQTQTYYFLRFQLVTSTYGTGQNKLLRQAQISEVQKYTSPVVEEKEEWMFDEQ